MTKEELVKLADQSQVEDSLDDLVHDTASSIASDVNNSGYQSQIEYLLEAGVTAVEIEKRIREA